MKNILFSVFLIQLGASQVCSKASLVLIVSAYPGSQGVGSFAYQDTAGNRYGGTYGLKDGQVIDSRGNFPPSFQPQSFLDFDDFFPEYFRNLENLLQEAFKKNLEHQKLALNAAKKAYDLTSNQASFIPNFPDRFTPFSGFPFDYGMSGFGGPNSAFAGAAAGPDFTHHIASINPSNPMMPNVDVFQQERNGGGPGYVGVSSSSYSSSSNINGLPQSTRGSETVINKDGKVTRYSVHN